MNFDEEIDRRHSDSLKWNVFGENVLPMWVADTDFKAPQAVIDALHTRVDHGVFGYAFPPEGLSELLQAHLARNYAWSVQGKELSYIPGIVTGINLALRAFCKPGDAVIYHTPAYPPFISAPLHAGLRGVQNPLLRDDSGVYTIDFELFERQIVENDVRLFILCNPQNPTGRVFSPAELSSLAEICLRHRVLICADEIHCDLVYDGHKHLPIASLSPEVALSTLTFFAPSKTYNIAGLHASVAVIQNAELEKTFKGFRAGLVSNPGLLALTAAKAAFEHGGEWLQAQLVYLQANRDLLAEALRGPLQGISWAKCEATFLAWLDCRALGLELTPQKFFEEKAHVGLNDGLEFGPVGAGFVRLNFGTTRANLQVAIERMGIALAKR